MQISSYESWNVPVLLLFTFIIHRQGNNNAYEASKGFGFCLRCKIPSIESSPSWRYSTVFASYQLPFSLEIDVCMEKLHCYTMNHRLHLRLATSTTFGHHSGQMIKRNLQEFTVWSIRNNITLGPAQIIVWVNMKRAGIVCSVSVDSLKVYEDVAGCTEVLLASPGRFEGIWFIDTDITRIFYIHQG